MFDLNEFPENEGLALLQHSAEAKAECDVVVAARDRDEEEAFYTSENSAKIICRLVRDDESQAKDRAPLRTFLRLDSSSSMPYSDSWQPTAGSASLDGSEIDTDNEVTVAALDARSILDNPCVSGLDGAVSLVMPAQSGSSFGISPRPEKLGHRADLSLKHSNFGNFHRLAGKWDGFQAEKRGSERLEDGLKFDSRQSSPYSALVSSRKGKRAREDESLSVADTVIKLKRHVRPASCIAGPDAYHGAGPSLPMAIDQDAAAKNLSFTSVYKMSSKAEGSAQDAATALALGEAARTTFDSRGVVRPVAHVPIAVAASLGLCMTAIPIVKTIARNDGDLDGLLGFVEEQEGEEIDNGMGETRSKIASVVAQAQAVGDVSSKTPFWRGQLCAEGFSMTHVEAFCSEDLQSTSKLWNMPQTIVVENLVKIKEFLAAVRRADVVEPVIRVVLLPDAAAKAGQSFGAMVRNLNMKKGRAKDRSTEPELQLGWQSGFLRWRNGVLASTGAEFVFVATLKLKQVKGSGRRTSGTLFLVPGSSWEAVSDMDRELGRRLLGELELSCFLDQDVLFGFLCMSEETDRMVDTNRVVEGIMKAPADVEVPVTKVNVPVVVPEVMMVKVQVVNGVELFDVEQSKFASEDCSDGLARVENEDSSFTDAFHPAKVRDHKEHSIDNNHEARRLDKPRARKDNHSLRYYHILSENEVHKDRERQRDRERDLRSRDRERDPRSNNKDGHRYAYRSIERAELFKRGRSKEKELDRFREREHHRDIYRDLPDRSKSSKDRIKEQEKQKDKDRQRDRERAEERDRFVRKRGLSVESEKGKMDTSKVVLELVKAGPSLKDDSHDHWSRQSGKESRKRVRVGREDGIASDVRASETHAFQLVTEVSARTNGVLDNKSQPGCAIRTESIKVVDESVDGKDDVLSTDVLIAKPRSLAETGLRKARPMDVEEVQAGEEIHGSHEILNELLAGQTEQTANRPSVTGASPGICGTAQGIIEVRVAGEENSSVNNGCDMPQLGVVAAHVAKQADTEMLPPDHDDTREIEGTRESGRSKTQQDGGEGVGDDNKTADQVGNEIGSLQKSIGKPHCSSVDTAGEQGKEKESGVTELSVGPNVERTVEVQMLGNVEQLKSRASLSIQVDNMFDTAEGRKSDDNGTSQELLASPRKCSKSCEDELNGKTSISGAEDSQGNLAAVQCSHVLESGLACPSLSLSADGKEVSCEILLEGCDKETRVWLVSKQSASYLSEEFGVRIARLEEMVEAKSDTRLKNHPGPLSVRVFLVTEKPTDANEAKWFMSQAADMLRALAIRGVFAKCLWYQGPVQRYSGDQAPSIQVVVKRIKGEDGKNLERIQDETGVMIGIVLDANNKKGLVNSTRVIGLRLKCTRKKGLLEAAKQLEDLLSHVAQQFSKRAGVTGSQDISLLQLKVDFSNNTSPSSGILTPMQKDVFAAYSPVSPVAALSPLGSFKSKLDEPSTEAMHACVASTTAPTATLPASSLGVVNGNPPAILGEYAARSQQSEDEEPDNFLLAPDPEAKCYRPLYVSNIPERASASMLRELFEDLLRENLNLPDLVSNMVLDVRVVPDKLCAFVEFSTDDLLMEVVKMYADNKADFCGLKLELGSSAGLQKLDRMFLAARNETSSKGLDYGGGAVEPLAFAKPRNGRKVHKSDGHPGRLGSTLRSSSESDIEVLNHDRRYGARDAGMRHLRVVEKPKPLFLTELMRNASARLIHTLFEDILKKFVSPSLGIFKGRGSVLDVRYIPSRGCAFVDLSTSELVDFMLDLHSRRPEVFYHMKMEIGRRPVPLGHGEEEPVVKRSSFVGRNALVEESHGYGHSRKIRRYYPSTSPPRRSELAVMDQDFVDDYEDDDEDERQPSTSRKRRSDPERTVYADRLPENASEGMIRRIFERVLREHMTEEQLEVLGEQPITEVRYVPTKFCAFVVFVAEEITRLVLQLYNQDEETFENMRLKPHFHSRMEDLYREELHSREDGTQRVLSRDLSMDRRSRRGMDDFQGSKHSGADASDLLSWGRSSSAHRTVASTAFKEVDRRRSVYVDRIPERLPEPAIRELFERALRQNRHGYDSHVVSQVTFFRDKFDPDKLCSFVELDNEELVQELLDVYLEDEDAFSGMRVRPAVKFGS